MIGLVMAVLVAGKFKHPPTKFARLEEGDEMWKWPLPDMEGSVAVMGEEDISEVDNVVVPDLWFYRRKDKAFQEAHKWGGMVWWRPFEVAEGGIVQGSVQGEDYVERALGRRNRRRLYLETVNTTDEICRDAGFSYVKLDKGWRGYSKRPV